MATDFWASSHYTRWTVDRATLKRARAIDLEYVDDPDHLALLSIFFANLMSKLGNKLALRQRVIATATVFFRRFYLRNSYCETDPYIVLAACCYVAAKVEESPVHIKNVVSEARNAFNEYGIKNFTTDNSKLAEMEFYLVDDLKCDLTVFHPYRTLMTLVKELGGSTGNDEVEAGELGRGIDDGPRYWGTGEGRLVLHSGAIQMAWFMINDTYRSDLCLLYPPHLLAIAALYITCIFQPQTRKAHVEWTELQAAAAAAPPESVGPATRRSSRHASASGKDLSAQAQTPAAASDQSQTSRKNAAPPQDFVGFFAGLNVNMPLVATIAQEMMSFYALCDQLKDDFNGTPPTRPQAQAQAQWTRGKAQASSSHSGSRQSSSTPNSSEPGDDPTKGVGVSGGSEITPAFLVETLLRMRSQRDIDLAHPASGRPVAVNKVLERAQAAG